MTTVMSQKHGLLLQREKDPTAQVTALNHTAVLEQHGGVVNDSQSWGKVSWQSTCCHILHSIIKILEQRILSVCIGLSSFHKIFCF
jgi:hypothetical protein